MLPAALVFAAPTLLSIELPDTPPRRAPYCRPPGWRRKWLTWSAGMTPTRFHNSAAWTDWKVTGPASPRTCARLVADYADALEDFLELVSEEFVSV